MIHIDPTQLLFVGVGVSVSRSFVTVTGDRWSKWTRLVVKIARWTSASKASITLFSKEGAEATLGNLRYCRRVGAWHKPTVTTMCWMTHSHGGNWECDIFQNGRRETLLSLPLLYKWVPQGRNYMQHCRCFPFMDLVIFYRQPATWLPKALQAEYHHRSVGGES